MTQDRNNSGATPTVELTAGRRLAARVGRALPLFFGALALLAALLLGNRASAGVTAFPQGERSAAFFPLLAALEPGGLAAPSRANLRPELSPNIVPVPPPWGSILLTALGLGVISYIFARNFLPDKNRDSGRHSRGGWVFGAKGLGQISGAGMDEDVEGGSHNFTGGGAEGNW